jgi:hypothetical protein
MRPTKPPKASKAMKAANTVFVLTPNRTNANTIPAKTPNKANMANAINMRATAFMVRDCYLEKPAECKLTGSAGKTETVLRNGLLVKSG